VRGMASPRARRAAIVIVAGIVAVTCVALGLWQLRRLEDRRALNARIVRARAAPAVTVGTAGDVAGLAPFRRVEAAGTYDAGGEVLLYGRSLGGRPGHHVVTPLELSDGSGVLVVRGWVPFGVDAAPVRGPAVAAAGEVVVEGWLVPPETRGQSTPDRRGVMGTLDIERVGERVDVELAPLAIQLRTQRPARSGAPTPIPPPALSEGPHLSYVIQWFSFAAVAVAGAAILVRRERRGATTTP
jgi:cytochrome oxidase assembly protein ShyY1